MKKRLLITSIVMMLVVAVALSTATYAWFTSNTQVTAQNITMQAGVPNAESISIGWFGSELKGTSLQSAANGTGLQPMMPVALTSTTDAAAYAYTDDEDDTNDHTTGVRFTGAFVDVDGNFASAGTEKTPYTWNNGSGVTAFYINNDSNSQPVAINVTATISNYAEPVALADNTLLEGGKVYYKKTGDTYTKLIAGTDYTANVSKVTDAASSEAPNINTGLASGTIYSTKGVQDYVRVAIFATSAQSSPLTGSVAPENYTYKGLLAKTAGTNTVYGEITAESAASSQTKMASTETVEVISTLPALNRVYVIVKVWLDGADFTEHEKQLLANVSLTFSSATAH